MFTCYFISIIHESILISNFKLTPINDVWKVLRYPKPHTLSNVVSIAGSIHGTPLFEIESSSHIAFSWISLMSWNLAPFQVGFDFWKKEVVWMGWDLRNMMVVRPVECCIWPKTAAQDELNGQVCCHRGIATHQMACNYVLFWRTASGKWCNRSR